MPTLESPLGGQASSLAAVLLAAGTKGKRLALPNSRIVIHQPVGDAQGSASNVDIHAREILRLRELVSTILVKHTGQTPGKIRQDTDRDFIMTAEEAVEYGFIDQIVRRRVLSAVT